MNAFVTCMIVAIYAMLTIVCYRVAMIERAVAGIAVALKVEVTE